MPPVSASVSVASSSLSPRRRRGLRTATSSSNNITNSSTNKNNKSFLLSRSVGSFSSKNKYGEMRNTTTNSTTSGLWPLVVPDEDIASRGGGESCTSGNSLFGEVWQAPPSNSSSSSPRSVASMRNRASPGSGSSRSVKSSASSRRSPQNSGSSSNRSVVSAVRASPNHSSLELTTVAEGDATMMSAGSTATGDSFILQLDDDRVVDDNGFLLNNYHTCNNLLDDSFEDPYLQSKQDLRLRKKKASSINDDERDYFCNATTAISSSSKKTTIPRRRSGVTLDTECSTGEATSAAAADALNNSSVAVRYIAGEAAEEKEEDHYHRHDRHPPLSRLDGIPCRKHFHETDEVSVPSQNEQHGGDVSCFDNHHHCDNDDETQATATLLTADYGASLDSIEVDDRQGILMENSVSCRETTLQRQRQARDAQALYYWNTLLTTRIMTYGQEHFKTAETWLELGNAHMEAKEYHAALGAYTCAQRILRQHYYPHRPVALARALDRMGVACSKTARYIDPNTSVTSDDADDDELTPEEIFSKAIDLLLEALQIRYDELGPWHVDTVDCLNHLAWVQYDAGLFNQARRSFWEVFFCRKAIFGSPHPGVAVAAHDLANCFFKLGHLSNADNFYSIALEIYDNMNVRMQNPAVARLLRDMKRLERLQKSF